jgi:hypothetical protein
MAVHACRSDAAAVKLPVFFRLFVLDGHLWRCKGKEKPSAGISHPHEAAKPFHLNEWTGVFVVARWPVRVGP